MRQRLPGGPAMPRLEHPRFYADLRKRIRARRLDLDLSQCALGRRSGVSNSAISNIENGRERPALPTLLSLCYGLRIGLPELLVYRTTPR